MIKKSSQRDLYSSKDFYILPKVVKYWFLVNYEKLSMYIVIPRATSKLSKKRYRVKIDKLKWNILKCSNNPKEGKKWRTEKWKKQREQREKNNKMKALNPKFQ